MKLALCILGWASHRTLVNTLLSYRDNGLLDLADEKLIYFQEMNDQDIQIAKRFGLTVYGSETNIGIGPAYLFMAEKAKSDFVLFLQDDFVLAQDLRKDSRELDLAMRLLADGTIDTMRLRHRQKPGFPLWSTHLNGHEESMPTHLLECVFWRSDPDILFPDKIQKINADPVLYMASSAYANYTCNPCLYRRQWFIDKIEPFCHTPGHEHEDQTHRWWRTQAFRVAVGEGLFTHVRIDRDRPVGLLNKLRLRLYLTCRLNHLTPCLRVLQWFYNKIYKFLRTHGRKRIFATYCNILRRLKCARPPKIAWKELNEKLPLFASIVRAGDVPLLYYSIKYLMQNSACRPRMLLVGDSERALETLKEWFSDCPADILMVDWREYLAKLDESERRFIMAWLLSGPWGGFAKRFATAWALNKEKDVLFFDADILWHTDFPSALLKILDKDNTIHASQDWQPAYHEKLAHEMGEPRILKGAPINVGLIYYPQGLLPCVLTKDFLAKMLPFVEWASYHTEQTLLAYIFWRMNGKFFDENFVGITIADNLKLRKTDRFPIRHYAGTKHLFWRDA